VLFGPKFPTSSGPFRAYVTGKLGLINFSVSDQNAPAGFVGALGGIQTGDTRFAMYPGGGVEGFWGPIGLRLEAGDEIYFDNGTHNNFKVTFRSGLPILEPELTDTHGSPSRLPFRFFAKLVAGHRYQTAPRGRVFHFNAPRWAPQADSERSRPCRRSTIL
jgi:hypothetical protein